MNLEEKKKIIQHFISYLIKDMTDEELDSFAIFLDQKVRTMRWILNES